MIYTHGHVLIAGFTQRIGAGGNGIYRLFDEIYRRYAGPDTLVEYFPWYIKPAAIAGAIQQRALETQHATGLRIRIQLIGYSFGGQTAAHVCDQLRSLGVVVDHVTLCDPVARFGRLGWMRAANPFGSIVLPANVRNAAWIFQRNPQWRLTPPFFFPRSHRVICSPATELSGPWESSAEHEQIDNDFTFHQLAMGAAADLHHHAAEDSIDA